MVRTTIISPWIETGFRLVGMWSNSPYPNLHWISYTIFTLVMLYHQYLYIILHFDTYTLTLLMDYLGSVFANNLALLKLIVLRWNLRVFHDSLSAINEDWKESVKDEFSRSIIMTVSEKAYYCSCLIITIHGMAGFSFMVCACVSNAYSDTDVRELPLKMDFFFDPTTSPFLEYIFIAAQFLYLTAIASIDGVMNASFVSLVLHAGGQIDILKRDLIQISVDRDPRESFAAVRNLVLRHRKIIAMSENIENVFSFIALLQLFWNSVIICSCSLLIVITLSNNEGISMLIKIIIFYIAKTSEVFVFCYAGEFLSEKNKSISDAAYESPWYNMLPSNSRVLLFMIIRSQKRLTITAGRIVDLTLDRFISVMKASASYMSVLLAMY